MTAPDARSEPDGLPDQDDLFDPADEMSEGVDLGSRDEVPASFGHGTTAREESEGARLGDRVAAEQPDPSLDGLDPETGSATVAMAPRESDARPGGASAEESALHVEPGR